MVLHEYSSLDGRHTGTCCTLALVCCNCGLDGSTGWTLTCRDCGDTWKLCNKCLRHFGHAAGLTGVRETLAEVFVEHVDANRHEPRGFLDPKCFAINDITPMSSTKTAEG